MEGATEGLLALSLAHAPATATKYWDQSNWADVSHNPLGLHSRPGQVLTVTRPLKACPSLTTLDTRLVHMKR